MTPFRLWVRAFTTLMWVCRTRGAGACGAPEASGAGPRAAFPLGLPGRLPCVVPPSPAIVPISFLPALRRALAAR